MIRLRGRLTLAIGRRQYSKIEGRQWCLGLFFTKIVITSSTQPLCYLKMIILHWWSHQKVRDSTAFHTLQVKVLEIMQLYLTRTMFRRIKTSPIECQCPLPPPGPLKPPTSVRGNRAASSQLPRAPRHRERVIEWKFSRRWARPGRPRTTSGMPSSSSTHCFIMRSRNSLSRGQSRGRDC